MEDTRLFAYLKAKDDKDKRQKTTIAEVLRRMKEKEEERAKLLALGVEKAQSLAQQALLQTESLRQAVDQLAGALSDAASREEIRRERELSSQLAAAFRNFTQKVNVKTETALNESVKKAEMRMDGGVIEYRRTPDEEWELLFDLSVLKGERGPRGSGIRGEKGEQGEKGENAPYPIYQFSSDGNAWKSGYEVSDVYTRVSVDGGVTFSDAIVIKGAKGDKGDRGEIGPQGQQGVQGIPGEPFQVKKVYDSISAMEADFGNAEIIEGQFVVIDTGDVEDPDNAKLFYKGLDGWVYLTDMSGAEGIQGPPGVQGLQGMAATLSIGEVTTGAPGTSASVENVGTENAALLNIAIPRGDVGPAGTTDYNQLQNKPTKLSQFANDQGFLSQEVDPTVPGWAKAANKPGYSATEVGALPISGGTLTGRLTLGADGMETNSPIGMILDQYGNILAKPTVTAGATWSVCNNARSPRLTVPIGSNGGPVTIDGNSVWHSGNFNPSDHMADTQHRFRTQYGHVDIAPMNELFAHIYTDRQAFYFDKPVYIHAGQEATSIEDRRTLTAKQPRYEAGYGTYLNNARNEFGFAYSNANAATTGPFISFGRLNSTNEYQAQIQTAYQFDYIAFRRCNPESSGWGPWRQIWHDGNVTFQTS